MENKVLIYTCCNDKYSHFIPLFAASALASNENIDIEIGVNLSKLSDKEETFLNNLRNLYPNSRIQIDYNRFETLGNAVIFNNQKMIPNTVRFVAAPFIHDEYTYISDIDIIMFDHNFYEQHLLKMQETMLPYSNIVRPNTNRLTGLHFCKSDKYFPVIPLSDKDLLKNDEEILYQIVYSKDQPIDRSLTFRPVHGIHMSMNRPDVGGTFVNGKMTIPGWEAKQYKEHWKDFQKSAIYKDLLECLDLSILDMIDKLNDYYKDK